MAENRADEPLDPKLTRWLQDEVARRLLPPHWETEVLKLISWATTYQDGKALHALILSYPRRTPPPAPPTAPAPQPDSGGAAIVCRRPGGCQTVSLPAPETGPRQRSLKQAQRARYDPADNADRLEAGQPQRRPAR
jgi:hypothetical protein